MTNKNVEGAESGTKVSEYDMTKWIEILSQQGKYKILTHEEYELLSHRKLSVKKEDSVFGQFPTGYNTSTPREVGDEVPPRPPPPTPLRKYFHDYSGINDVKPKVSFNLGREIPDMAGNVLPYQRPRLPNFSGEPKSETSFDVWKFEAKCLLREHLYPDLIIVQCMRNSLKGQARNTLLTLPESATPLHIIDKLEGIYGNVYSSDTLLLSFYAEKQMIGQSVADYGMKLESILQKVYDTGILNPKVKNDMLRAKFWSGLRNPALKNATRYKYDIIKNFDELRKEVRAVELELEISGASKPENTASHQPVSAVSDMSELVNTLELLNKRLDNFEGELKKVKESKQPDDQSKQQSSGNYENYNRGSYRGSFNTYQGHEVRGRSRYRGFGRGQVSSSINKDQNRNLNRE
jgi:hypothetical protein